MKAPALLNGPRTFPAVRRRRLGCAVLLVCVRSRTVCCFLAVRRDFLLVSSVLLTFATSLVSTLNKPTLKRVGRLLSILRYSFVSVNLDKILTSVV